MALDYFISKFYSFPPIDKEILRKYKSANDLDKWIIATILIPTELGKDFLALVVTNNMSVFDKIEEELSAVEINIEEYAIAAKSIGGSIKFFV